MNQKRILIIDDEELILTTLEADLMDNDYVITTANSGEKGIGNLEKNHFDLLITDLSLEGMDGIEVLEKAKKLDPDLAVIILTGFGSVDTAIDALRLGADDYLLKPCNLEELLFRISGALAKQELNQKIRIYEDILPVCCMCKKIRDDSGTEIGKGDWLDADTYLQQKAGVNVTHGYCPECYQKSLKALKS